MANKTIENVAMGTAAGTGAYLFTGIPINALLGYIPAIWVKPDDPAWGIGADDLINIGAGAGLAVFSKGKWKEIGLGWLLAYGAIKIGELYPIIAKALNIQTRSVLSSSAFAGALYAGPENPQPSPFAEKASPQAQLVVGTPVSCSQAGMHAQNQVLFV